MTEAVSVIALWKFCFLKIEPFASLLWWYSCYRGFCLLASSLYRLCLSVASGWLNSWKLSLSQCLFPLLPSKPRINLFFTICICDSLASTYTLNLLRKFLYKGEKAQTWNLWSLRFEPWLRGGGGGTGITDGNLCYILISFLHPDHESLLSPLTRSLLLPSLLLWGRNKAGRTWESLFTVLQSIVYFYFVLRQSRKSSLR